MRCSRCGRKRPDGLAAKCPNCGHTPKKGTRKQADPAASGVFQTSSVLIVTQGAELVYRSMDEVPHPLRTKLMKSTNGANSATILIADRRGREEIARVMRSLGRTPGKVQRRTPLHALLSRRNDLEPRGRLTPRRKMAVLLLLFVLALGFIAALFGHPWGML
jgi:hypothetical protein